MAIRKIDSKIPVPNIEKIKQLQVLHWHTLTCELVTPLYGGGVQEATVDKEMPIRVSAIRGQLRFWWRLLAKHKADWGFNGDLVAIRQAESQLWGGAGAEVRASLVFLKITDVSHLNAQPWAKYEPHHSGGFKTTPTAEKSWADVLYALFPAQGKLSPDRQHIKEQPKTLIQAELTWTLNLAFDVKTNTEQKNQVWEAIRWWASFGGVGARTRRGLGAVQVIGQPITPVTSAEVEAIGGQLVCRAQSDKEAYTAWKEAINKLQSFRQGDVGRNPGAMVNRPGRSRWPEPDAIRRITKQHLVLDLKNHKPEHKAGNLFPRAAFGLPIIFKFKDDKLKDKDKKNVKNCPEPQSTILKAVVANKIQERMASPLILRPYFNGQGWQAAALLLPHPHVHELKLELIPTQDNESQKQDKGKEVEYWDRAQAENIRPINDQDGTDALSAFLNYFGN